MLLLNCSGDCLFKMQFQEGSEDTGAGKHEAAQDTQGTQEYDIMAVPLTRSTFRTLKRSQGLPEVWLQYLARPSP